MAKAVLIIEDEPDANAILAQVVAQQGFDVFQTYSGRDGLAQARKQPPDLLLLDLMLPDVDGFEICETLRASRETNLIPIVMATALADTEHRVHGYRVGANCYVAKPYTREQILQAIDKALAWKQEIIHNHVEGEISFDVASEMQFLIEVNDILSSLFLLTPLDERSAARLRRALLEMGQNAIEWGNRSQVDKPVKITYRLQSDRVVLTIRDQGAGFTPDRIPHAARDEDPLGHIPVREVMGLREGGFGILITRGLVDEMKYNEAGNEVTIVQKFAARAMAAD